MSQTVVPYVKISSFAAPTAEDLAVWETLSDDEKRALLHAKLDKAKASGISDKSMADIRREALRQLGQLPDYAV
ncbi:MAG: hypothetical protein AAF826_05755 [Pseudomonadota bacterium]